MEVTGEKKPARGGLVDQTVGRALLNSEAQRMAAQHEAELEVLRAEILAAQAAAAARKAALPFPDRLRLSGRGLGRNLWNSLARWSGLRR